MTERRRGRGGQRVIILIRALRLRGIPNRSIALDCWLSIATLTQEEESSDDYSSDESEDSDDSDASGGSDGSEEESEEEGLTWDELEARAKEGLCAVTRSLSESIR